MSAGFLPGVSFRQLPSFSDEFEAVRDELRRHGDPRFASEVAYCGIMQQQCPPDGRGDENSTRVGWVMQMREGCWLAFCSIGYSGPLRCRRPRSVNREVPLDGYQTRWDAALACILGAGIPAPHMPNPPREWQWLHLCGSKHAHLVPDPDVAPYVSLCGAQRTIRTPPSAVRHHVRVGHLRVDSSPCPKCEERYDPHTGYWTGFPSAPRRYRRARSLGDMVHHYIPRTERRLPSWSLCGRQICPDDDQRNPWRVRHGRYPDCQRCVEDARNRARARKTIKRWEGANAG